MKLILVDAEVALIPSMRSYDPGQELRASVVRHPQLVEALVWLFESVCDQSVPIISSAGYNANDPRRQMLISLLMTGSTDNAIATQLGINVRSVRRWISELMDELGVTTRLQLGAALVRSGQPALKSACPRGPRRQPTVRNAGTGRPACRWLVLVTERSDAARAAAGRRIRARCRDCSPARWPSVLLRPFARAVAVGVAQAVARVELPSVVRSGCSRASCPIGVRRVHPTRMSL